MLIKATVLGFLLASTPIAIVATQQDPTDSEPGASTQPSASCSELDDLKHEVARLRNALQRAEARAEAAESAAEKTATRFESIQLELDETLDMLVTSTERRREHNCTPSRTRSLITYYQWMEKRGHAKRAKILIDRYAKSIGNDTNRLNSYAWSLMTDKESAGKYDRVALALAERMEKKSKLRHNQIDTIALAKFLNGHIDEAIAMQKKAIESGGNSSDYRRRLRTYQAAKLHADTVPAAKLSQLVVNDND